MIVGRAKHHFGICRCGCGLEGMLTRSGWLWSHWLSQDHARRAISTGHADVSGSKNPMHGKCGRLAPKWNPNREEVEMRARLRGMSKSLLRRALSISGHSKTRKTEDLLGYTREELREHLEKQFVDGMTWENYGDEPGCWHIDHIRPISSFPLGSPVSVVSALSNIRPLWKEENHRKWKKWEGQ